MKRVGVGGREVKEKEINMAEKERNRELDICIMYYMSNICPLLCVQEVKYIK